MAGGLPTEIILDDDFDRDAGSAGDFATLADWLRYAEEERFGRRNLGVWEACTVGQIACLIGEIDRIDQQGWVVARAVFVLSEEPRVRRRFDVAFVSSERWPLDRPIPPTAAWSVVPDLAVEVVDPTDRAVEVQAKVARSFRLGVRLVWVVYPRQIQVYVYRSAVDVQILGRDDIIDGGDVLLGFSTPVARIFENLEGDAPADEAEASPS